MRRMDVLARGARRIGHSQSAEHWFGSIGPTLFELARSLKILCGPSGGTQARCNACESGGHPAPVVLNRTTGEYEILCLEAGVSTVSAESIQQYRVDQTVFLCEVGRALGVTNPERQLRNLGNEVFHLGRGWLGGQPFALVAAMSLRTDDEISALHRRNRQGFGETTGLILCCDVISNPEPRDGFHSVCSFGTALSFSASGLHPNVSEIRGHLGLPGRPAKEMTLVVDVRKTLQTIVDGLGYIPKGNAARQLLTERRPDLAHVSRSTFFAAKGQVIPPPTEANSTVQD